MVISQDWPTQLSPIGPTLAPVSFLICLSKTSFTDLFFYLGCSFVITFQRRCELKFSLIILASFLLMEPATALIHRYVMHIVGWAWHKSHHERIGKPFELNDLFPIIFSFVAIALFLLGRSNSVFTAIGIGVTLYGLVYFVVHELIIHSRFFKIANNISFMG